MFVRGRVGIRHERQLDRVHAAWWRHDRGASSTGTGACASEGHAARRGRDVRPPSRRRSSGQGCEKVPRPLQGVELLHRSGRGPELRPRAPSAWRLMTSRGLHDPAAAATPARGRAAGVRAARTNACREVKARAGKRSGQDVVRFERKRAEHGAQRLVAQGPGSAHAAAAVSWRAGTVSSRAGRRSRSRPHELEPAVRRPAVQYPSAVRHRSRAPPRRAQAPTR